MENKMKIKRFYEEIDMNDEDWEEQPDDRLQYGNFFAEANTERNQDQTVAYWIYDIRGYRTRGPKFRRIEGKYIGWVKRETFKFKALFHLEEEDLRELAELIRILKEV